MRHAAIAITASVLLAGCGGDGGSPDLIYKSAPPEGLSVSGPPEALEVSWTAPEMTENFNVYYSSDPQQWIGSYAAYDDAGLVMTTDTSVVLDLSAIERHIYFQVTGEIDLEGAPSFAVGLLGYRLNDELVEDHIKNLQWRRCPEGMTFDAGTCTGSYTEMSGVNATSTYGTEASGTDWRPPTHTEWQSITDCGREPSVRFDDAHTDACRALLPDMLLGHGNLPFFVYDDQGYCPSGQLLTVTPQGAESCVMPVSGTVRIALVKPSP